jgi:hypothetical protein
MRPAIDMDLIEIHDLVFDNNARGSTPPPSPFDYEQSHTIRFAGATGTTTKLLRYHNVIVKDPAADGMNNQDVGIIQNWVISNCSEIDRTRVRSSIQQSHMAENLVITGFAGQRIESEPVANLTTEKTVLISNSRLEILDMAGRGDNSLARYFISNTTVSQDMNVSRCILSISNSNIKIGTTGTGRFNYLAVGSQISDTTLRLNYNDTTGVVTGVDLYGNTADSGPHSCTFDNVNFLIDYQHDINSGNFISTVGSYFVVVRFWWVNSDCISFSICLTMPLNMDCISILGIVLLGLYPCDAGGVVDDRCCCPYIPACCQ